MYFVALENYADCTHVIGLGESQESVLEEPLNNGFEISDIIVKQISKEQYDKYIDMYC